MNVEKKKLDEQRLLERFMWLSIAASVLVIALKVYAAWVTGSVGFLSDAIESLINLVAAAVGLWALKLAAKPADDNHNFGHAKAEYFSAQVEGTLILVASVAIIVTAVQRILNPQPLEQLGIGLLFSILATLINLAVGFVLVRAGRQYRSSTLEADGTHLLTDVWTTAGVLTGMALVWLTGWQVLDPVVALLVGANILFTGYKLLRQAIQGLLSEALPEDEVAAIQQFLDAFGQENGVEFTSLRTTAFGRERLINVVMQVPGEWTVAYSHAHADEVESGVARALGGAETIVHIEPLGFRTRTGPMSVKVVGCSLLGVNQTPHASAPAPHAPAVAPQPRLIVPDLARGLALAGIAMANAVQAWVTNSYDEGTAPGHTLGGVRDGSTVDQIAAMFSAVFVHVRGLPMFSTLLGFGIGLIAASLYRKGYPAGDARKVLIRRYGFLALFGLAHMFLLFYGDIMFFYGVIGIIVACMITLSSRWLRVMAYTALILFALFGTVGAVAVYHFNAPTGALDMPVMANLNSFGEYFVSNAAAGAMMVVGAPFAALQLGGLVIIGFVWAREGVLVDIAAHRRTLWTWVVVAAVLALGIGVPWGLAAIGVINPQLEMSLLLLNEAWGVFTGPGILAALALATHKVGTYTTAPRWAWPFVALGKRSMSGYLAQSFLFIALAMPFTLDLGSGASVTGKLLVGLTVWLITLALAVLLEQLNISGPFEQLHRRASYGPAKRLQPYAGPAPQPQPLPASTPPAPPAPPASPQPM